MKGSDVLLLRGREIPVELAKLPQSELLFYLENPRLYTVIRADGKEPTQEEVETALCRMEHVKNLARSIKENGGLIDALIVQSRNKVVLEGNSRLAAYRILAKQDPIRWGLIYAKLLPDSITESEIFSLLGEYHIIGKKDWVPFEQAGYLFRRNKTHGISVQQLASEVNLSERKIAHLINVYQFMQDLGERDVDRWSYYDEYLKSSLIRKARKTFPQLDQIVPEKIGSGEIEKAVNIRDDLKKIVLAGGRVLERFATGKRPFAESLEAASDKGADDDGVKRLKKFRQWLGHQEVQEGLVALKGELGRQGRFEIKKLHSVVERLYRRLDGSQS